MVRSKLPCSLNAVNNETSEVATKGSDSKALLGDLLVNEVTHVEHGIKISTSADQKEKKKQPELQAAFCKHRRTISIWEGSQCYNI